MREREEYEKTTSDKKDEKIVKLKKFAIEVTMSGKT